VGNPSGALEQPPFWVARLSDCLDRKFVSCAILPAMEPPISAPIAACFTYSIDAGELRLYYYRTY
jgi:hypothetical protein